MFSRNSGPDRRALLATAFYILALIGLCVHLYRTPVYDMDMIGYMGNALLTNGTSADKAHELVYAEIRRLPADARDSLLGLRSGDDPSHGASRKARAAHASYFAEFLPCFAIRPVYNQLLFLISRVSGLTRATILLAVVPYFLLGVLVFYWARRYASAGFAAIFSLLLMLMPPIASLGRTTISDALSVFTAALAVYLIFEKEQDAAGIGLLLLSIFVRTDNVILASLVFAALWWMKKLKFWQTAVLGIFAATCVVFINRMAGDYGLAMLYYRNFVDTPIAPAEMVVHFSKSDYLRAFREHLPSVLGGWVLAFLLLAVIGYQRRSRLTILSAIGLAYIALHYILLPNWWERWFVVAYIPMSLSACARVNLRPVAVRPIDAVARPEIPIARIS